MVSTQGPLQGSNKANSTSTNRGRKSGTLSDAAKQQAKKIKLEQDAKERAAVEAVLEMIDEQVDKLVEQFNKPEEYFLTQLHMGGDTLRQSREVSVYNAYVHASLAEHNKSKQS